MVQSRMGRIKLLFNIFLLCHISQIALFYSIVHGEISCIGLIWKKRNFQICLQRRFSFTSVHTKYTEFRNTARDLTY